MDGGDLLLTLAVVYIAAMSLVRLMRRKRDLLVATHDREQEQTRLREQAEKERAEREAERQAKRRERDKAPRKAA